MYFANTWHKFHFVITPDEFQTIFKSDNFFVITNSRVEMDYEFTESETIFDAYRQYFEKIILRKDKLARQAWWNIEQNIHISIIDDYCKLRFEPFAAKNENGKMYKLVKPTEPVMNISPFYLFFDKDKQKLSVAYLEEEGILGLMISYPKTISKRNKNGDLYGNFSTEPYKMASVFQEFIKSIKKITKKAKIFDGDKEYKPNFWISDSAKAVINENLYLKKKKLTIL